MNREILFRGKRVDNGEWVYGQYIKACEHWHRFGKHEDWITRGAIQNGGIINLWGRCAVIPETVGQFTGILDKNGKKIFEGDILLKGFEKVLVKWNANQCRWGIYSNNYEICGFNESTQGYFEVIGNIYDNSELLEVEK